MSVAGTVWVLNRNPLADTPGPVALNISLFTSGFVTGAITHRLSHPRFKGRRSICEDEVGREVEKRDPAAQGPSLTCLGYASPTSPCRGWGPRGCSTGALRCPSSNAHWHKGPSVHQGDFRSQVEMVS